MAYTTVPTKNPGDVFSATPMWQTYLRDNLNKGVVRPIAETTLSVAAASIDFSSIAADWSHLMIDFYGRGDAAVTATSCLLRFNADTGANYDYERVYGEGAAVAAAEALAATSLLVVGRLPGASAPANVFGAGAITVPYYASANQKTMHAAGMGKRGVAAGDLGVEAISGFWRNVAAITQITLLPASGNFAIGTRATLYGMGGI